MDGDIMIDYYDYEKDEFDCNKFYDYCVERIGTDDELKMNKRDFVIFSIAVSLKRDCDVITLKEANNAKNNLLKYVYKKISKGMKINLLLLFENNELISFYDKEKDEFDCNKFFGYYVQKLGTYEVSKMSKEEVIKYQFASFIKKHENIITLEETDEKKEQFFAPIYNYSESEVKKIDLLEF